MPSLQRHVFVCTNERPADNPKGCCTSKGAEAVRDAFKKQLAEFGLKGKVRGNAAGCLDACEHGVAVLIYPEQVWYGGVTVADVAEIVERHVIGGEVVERLMIEGQPHLGDVRRFAPIPATRLTAKPKKAAGGPGDAGA